MELVMYLVYNESSNTYLCWYFEGRNWTEAIDLALLHTSQELAEFHAKKYGGTVKRVKMIIEE